MAELSTDDKDNPIVQVSLHLDWGALAKSLGIETPEKAVQRAYEIARYIAKIENDKDSELILKTGNRKVSLTLKK